MTLHMLKSLLYIHHTVCPLKAVQIQLVEFRSVMLATLRSLVPKEWGTDHEAQRDAVNTWFRRNINSTTSIINSFNCEFYIIVVRNRCCGL